MNPYPYLAMFVIGAFMFAVCGEFMSGLEYAPREIHTEERDYTYRTLWMVQLFSAFLSIIGIFQLRTHVMKELRGITRDKILTDQNDGNPGTAQETATDP